MSYVRLYFIHKIVFSARVTLANQHKKKITIKSENVILWRTSATHKHHPPTEKSCSRKMKPIFVQTMRYFIKIFCIFHCERWNDAKNAIRTQRHMNQQHHQHHYLCLASLVSVRYIINHETMQKHKHVNDDLHRNVIAVIVFRRRGFFLNILFFISGILSVGLSKVETKADKTSEESLNWLCHRLQVVLPSSSSSST